MNVDDSDTIPGQQDSDEFDLVAPFTNLDELAELSKKKIGEIAPTRPRVKVDESMREFSWKGFEEPAEEVDPDPPLVFRERTRLTGDDGMDMTPMVDVTFLLLIFFMVTASFTVQKSLETPHAKIDMPSSNVVEDPDDSLEYVEVIIDQNNSYYVTTRGEGEVEAGSDRDMQARVRSAKEEFAAAKLIITAHVDSFHSKMVKVWDTGLSCGFDKIEVRTTETNY